MQCPLCLIFTTNSFNSNCKPQQFKRCCEEFLALARSIGMSAVSALDSTPQPQPFPGHAKEHLQFLGTFGISYVIDVLEHHGVLEIGLTSLQVVHFSIGETRAPVQGSTAVSTSANWRDVLPKLMLALPRLVRMQISGKSNQYILVVANSTPETDEDSIA